jgi:16S rRNA methyltransferase RsmB/F
VFGGYKPRRYFFLILAQIFPRILVNEGKNVLQFDRVLCDVPCSGDGTLRKNMNIWRRWNIADGNGLHKLQRQILSRGCELLKVGGRIVYSTCSFNPIENEAVVASLLSEAKGSVRLVDVTSRLPSLIRHPGLTSWKVADKTGKFYDEYPESEGYFARSMFPPADINSLGMENCLRIYPQDQNTGGFFVAVLEKVSDFGSVDRMTAKGRVPRTRREEVTAEEVEEVAVDESMVVVEEDVVVIVENEEEASGSPVAEQYIQIDCRPTKKAKTEEPGKAKFQGFKEAPFLLLPDDSPVVAACRDSYGLSADFPSGLFVVRSEKADEFSQVYIVSQKVKDVLLCDRLKIINSGVRVFKKHGGPGFAACPYRSITTLTQSAARACRQLHRTSQSTDKSLYHWTTWS